MRGRTQKESFEASGWMECPDNIGKKMKYSVDDGNSRVATKINICVQSEGVHPFHLTK